MTSLPFFAHGVTLALAWFLAIDVVLCAIVAAIAALALRSDTRRSAGAWIALRLLPSAAAAAFVALLFVPSYWKYEPREFVEGFDLTLGLAATAALALIAAGAIRGASAWRSAARRTKAWLSQARPLSIAGGTLPAFAVDSDHPIIALAGVRRPRLLITRGFIEALTPQELDAAVAHEVGHFRANDNLKRLLMRAAPDLLAPFRLARAIERRWALAAEHLADRAGGDGDPAVRCALASALVKVARLTPPSVPAGEPISALIAGGDIASRVRTLLDDGHAAGTGPSRRLRLAAVAAAAAAIALAYSPLLRSVHEITEIAVRSLP